MEGSVTSYRSKASVVERKGKWAGKVRLHSSSSSESCECFLSLESGGNSTRLPWQGCWTGKMTLGREGFEKTSCGYKGFIVLTQIAMELVINNTLLSQKVDVWSHNQEGFFVCLFVLMISREALSRDSPSVSQKLGDPLSEHTLEPLLNFLQSFTPKLLYNTGSSVMT